MKKTCINCRYFEDNKCHRFPPQLVSIIRNKQIPSFFSGVFPGGWCGEFKKRSLFAKKKKEAIPSVRLTREPPVGFKSKGL